MKKLNRVLITVIILAICVSPSALASTYASNYLVRYDAYIVKNSSGNISIWFDVTGTGFMDEIGALTIILKENNGSTWNTVQTYSHTNSAYSHILATDTNLHMDSVPYSGVAGRSYYAIVTIWAGKDGGGDSRSITTASIVA